MQQTKQLQYGQFFTPPIIADFMLSLATVSKDAAILDPCAGEGVFLTSLTNAGYRNITGYEVDTTLTKTIPIIHKSFVSEEIHNTFDLIIGNPPYVRWKNLAEELKSELQESALWQTYCNNLCDYLFIFILKAVTLLNENGELIFITPEYWLTTKHAQKMRDFMLAQGFFTDIIHFSEAPIFNNISSSIVIFKYIKQTSIKEKPQIRVVKYTTRKKITEDILDGLFTHPNETFLLDQFEKQTQWFLTREDVYTQISNYEAQVNGTLGEIVDIGNGMVSGLDKAFQIQDTSSLTETETRAILSVVKAKDLEPFTYKKVTGYVFLQHVKTEDELREHFPHFYQQLQPYKTQLQKRYNYQRDIPYWHWVFPRNYALFQKPKPRIFVPCKERISHKDYLRFAYISSGLFPTQDVTGIVLKENVRESIYYILALLNSNQVFTWIKHRGIMRGNVVEFSEAPLAGIPIKRIDWVNEKEVHLHDQITASVKQLIKKRNSQLQAGLQKDIDMLLSSSI